LQEFEQNHNQPVYPTNFFLPPASSTQVSTRAMAEQAALRD